jgi:uncharacterized protein YbjT (DUF2867 family)
MRILLTGASGFIGSHLAHALTAAGHEVVCAQRRPPKTADRSRCSASLAVDLTHNHKSDWWVPRLAGIDAVIYAAGILRERGAQTFDTLHTVAPQSLFEACLHAGVGKVVQISALGADDQAASRYHLSKRAADEFLLSLPLPAVIVQPSLVYGHGGTSARLFNLMASLPLIPLPGRGDQAIQPIHVDDLADAITAELQRDEFLGKRVALVGRQALTLREFMDQLRQAMGLGPARFLPIPLPLVRVAAMVGKLIPGSLLDRETLAMLIRGNTADGADTRLLLGRSPRGVADFIAPPLRASTQIRAQLSWLLSLARFAMALLWIVTGLLSLGLYPVTDSYALLARVGVRGSWAPVMLYGAALIDLALGLGVFLLRRRRLLWLAQIAMIAVYTAIITWRLPEFWLHPFAPILKNVPLLALLALLATLEDE